MAELLVLGDSFCANRTEPESWVKILKNFYPNFKLTGRGFGGQSWWHQRRWLLENFPTSPESTTAIFCHTGALRLPCVRDIPVTPWVLSLDDPTSLKNELLRHDKDHKIFHLAKSFYSSDLYDQKFYEWASEKWFFELSELTKNFKKVLHIFGFDSKENKSVLLNSNAIVCTTLLRSLSIAELSKNQSLPPSQIFGGPDTRLNHFNKHNNIQLALFLKTLIDEGDPKSSVCISNLSEWKLEDQTVVEDFII